MQSPDDKDPPPRGHAEARRAHILTKKSPAIGRGVAAAVAIKDGDVFLVTTQSGSIPMKRPHGFGLYHHDCRFLNGYLLKIDGRAPIALASTAAEGFKGIFEITNPELPKPGGGALDKHEISVRWDRVIEGERRALHEVLRVRNFTAAPVDITLTLSFRADFEDVYAVRGLCAEQPGRRLPPRWDGARLRLRYEGADDRVRTTDIHFFRRPDAAEGRRASFHLHLDAEAETEIALSIYLLESRRGEADPPAPALPDLAAITRRIGEEGAARAESITRIHVDHVPIQMVFDRSLRDLAMLRSGSAERGFYAAGVPWFVALFGRDSLLVALATLAYAPEIAEETLRLLAGYQARADDPSRDEEPGKILHERRVGELASVGAIPHTPYYGSVDSTPLFLALVARHAAWTGRLDLFRELRPQIDAALDWVSRYGESPEHGCHGYVAYRSRATGGLANQGWKDSGDAIVMENGDLARQPIALVEVQGYVYLAKQEIAALLDRAGEAELAASLRREAESLKQRFGRDYWLSDKGFFALALTPDGPAKVLSSNAGQALWSGIAGPEEARRTMERLLGEPMWSGWGIRTLSTDERRYNPLAYHRGTVWPHDNALIAAGFRRYGFDDAACQVFQGIVDASTHFPMHRLPEVFAGFRRGDYGVPVRYPVACHPQAWAAASVPYMLERLLGLTPEAFEGRLRVVRPVLPPSIGTLTLTGLRVGSGVVDLRFERGSYGRAEVQVLRREGALDVQVEQDGIVR